MGITHTFIHSYIYTFIHSYIHDGVYYVMSNSDNHSIIVKCEWECEWEYEWEWVSMERRLLL
jgi:hypothetical protein